MHNFYPIKTNDDSISLYNFEVDDVYHSKVGAYTEAVHKYVIPSNLLSFAKENSKIKILDVCYGLGYNSKAAINEIQKVHPDTKIHITALDNDPTVLAFSSIAENKQALVDYIEYARRSLPEIREKIPQEYELIPPDEIEAKLHNIYYRSHYGKNIKVDLVCQDARLSLLSLKGQYDFIFHDPFTPSKAPTLWTVEVFKELHRLLANHGNLTTYSNAAPVRSAMLEAGFYVGATTPIGKKTTGTIAYKKKNLVKTSLSGKELGILDTKAGIPYRDQELNKTTEEILLSREQERQCSNKISSSKFLKSIKVDC